MNVIIKRTQFPKINLLLIIFFSVNSYFGQSLDSTRSLYFLSKFNDSFPESLKVSDKLKGEISEIELIKQIIEPGVFYPYPRYESKKINVHFEAEIIERFDFSDYKQLDKNLITSFIIYNSSFEVGIRDMVSYIESDTSIQNNVDTMFYYDSILKKMEENYFNTKVQYDFPILIFYKKIEHCNRNKGTLIFSTQNRIVQVHFKVKLRNRKYWNKYSYENICDKISEAILGYKSFEFQKGVLLYYYNLYNSHQI